MKATYEWWPHSPKDPDRTVFLIGIVKTRDAEGFPKTWSAIFETTRVPEAREITAALNRCRTLRRMERFD